MFPPPSPGPAGEPGEPFDYGDGVRGQGRDPQCNKDFHNRHVAPLSKGAARARTLLTRAGIVARPGAPEGKVRFRLQDSGLRDPRPAEHAFDAGEARRLQDCMPQASSGSSCLQAGRAPRPFKNPLPPTGATGIMATCQQSPPSFNGGAGGAGFYFLGSPVAPGLSLCLSNVIHSLALMFPPPSPGPPDELAEPFRRGHPPRRACAHQQYPTSAPPRARGYTGLECSTRVKPQHPLAKTGRARPRVPRAPGRSRRTATPTKTSQTASRWPDCRLTSPSARARLNHTDVGRKTMRQQTRIDAWLAKAILASCSYALAGGLYPLNGIKSVRDVD